jgi:serralysin
MAQPLLAESSNGTSLSNIYTALISQNSWVGNLGEGRFLTYSFDGPWTSTGEGAFGEVSTLSEADRSAVRDILELYSNVANVVFSEVTDGTDGQIAIRNEVLEEFDGYAYLPGAFEINGNIALDTQLGAITPNTRAWYAAAHEVGHALGLEHPFDDNVSASTPKANGIPTVELTSEYSVMAYNGADDNSSGLKLYDIAAIQARFSPNYSYNSGDDTYTFSSSGTATSYALWDGNGNDIFSAADQTTGAIIDIRDGDYVNQIGVETVRIAFGAQIENAIGSSFDDTINGNIMGNVIVGGSGSDQMNGFEGNDILLGGWNASDATDLNDVIFGGLGSDTIYGNAGDDVLVGGSNFSDTADQADTIYGGLGNDQIYGNAGDDVINAAAGNDTLYGGLGNDIFQFTNGHGVDQVNGFDGAGQSGGDVIQLSRFINGTAIDNAATLLNFAATDGTHTYLATGNGDGILVLYTALSQFGADDFAFV